MRVLDRGGWRKDTPSPTSLGASARRISPVSLVLTPGDVAWESTRMV